jgi:hypothetical protein
MGKSFGIRAASGDCPSLAQFRSRTFSSFDSLHRTFLPALASILSTRRRDPHRRGTGEWPVPLDTLLAGSASVQMP